MPCNRKCHFSPKKANRFTVLRLLCSTKAKHHSCPISNNKTLTCLLTKWRQSIVSRTIRRSLALHIITTPEASKVVRTASILLDTQGRAASTMQSPPDSVRPTLTLRQIPQKVDHTRGSMPTCPHLSATVLAAQLNRQESLKQLITQTKELKRMLQPLRIRVR